MELKNIILHQIIREEGSKPILNLSETTLPIDNEIVIEFVSEFLKTYNKRRPTYGSFMEDEKEYPFQKITKEYLNKELPFVEYTNSAMELLKISINRPFTKGGYVVFFHYIENQSDFIVTTMLDNSAQFAVVEETLGLQKLKVLNLDELVRANRVNVKKWTEGDDSYLTFIKGKRNVSQFFQEFIGNTDLTSAKKNANYLNKAIKSYMRDKKYSYEEQSNCLKGIQEYVYKQINNREDIDIMSISSILNSEEPEDFKDFTIINDLPVSGRFRAELKKDFDFLYRGVVRGNGFKLFFERSLVKSGGIVRRKNDIIIKNVDEEYLNQEFGNIDG